MQFAFVIPPLHLSSTRQLKPSQRCSACWGVAKKTLSGRIHRSECGSELPRDQNSSRVVLLYAWTPQGSAEMVETVRLNSLAERSAKPKLKPRSQPGFAAGEFIQGAQG